MPQMMVSCGGVCITGRVIEILAGRPMVGPVRGDRQKLRITLEVTGDNACEQVAALKDAAGIVSGPMTARMALIMAANMIDAEIRRLDGDAMAFQHGCEDAEDNARRHDELSQALAQIKEILIDDSLE